MGNRYMLLGFDPSRGSDWWCLYNGVGISRAYYEESEWICNMPCDIGCGDWFVIHGMGIIDKNCKIDIYDKEEGKEA